MALHSATVCAQQDKEASRDLTRLLSATLFYGAVSGIFGSALNNYLNGVHGFDAHARGWLELPREIPGFLIIFVTSILLLRLRETQMAAVGMLLTAVGAAGLALLSSGMVLLVTFIVVWSLGDHILFTVEGPIGLKLAKSGGEGHRLGQVGGARNLGIILGVGVVYALAKWQGDRFDLFFLAAAAFAAIASFLYRSIRAGKFDARSHRWVFRREYGIFYAISALFGIRKQIFMVFGSWVLVSLHDVPVSTIAVLYFVSATLGVVLRPLLGDVIDWLGERTILAVDELLLLLVCLIYAFASHLLAAPHDLWLLFAAYILDNVLFALRVARTTYLKKIALDPGDITPSLSLGITIDHAVAMTLPILSGVIWERWGYEWVFVLAGAIALVGFFICLQIRIPMRTSQQA